LEGVSSAANTSRQERNATARDTRTARVAFRSQSIRTRLAFSSSTTEGANAGVVAAGFQQVGRCVPTSTAGRVTQARPDRAQRNRRKWVLLKGWGTYQKPPARALMSPPAVRFFLAEDRGGV
jgi:hypothetical protein